MKVVFRTRELLLQCRDGITHFFGRLRDGASFEEVYTGFSKSTIGGLHGDVRHPLECVIAFLLFHLYLAYVPIYAISKLVYKHTKVKGRMLEPFFPDFKGMKHKIAMAGIGSVLAIKYLSWLQWINPQTWASWGLNLRPQIVIKPEVSVMTASSCSHTCSSRSVSHSSVSSAGTLDGSVDGSINTQSQWPKFAVKVKTPSLGYAIGVQPNKETCALMKTTTLASDVLTTATDFYGASVDKKEEENMGDVSQEPVLIDYGITPSNSDDEQEQDVPARVPSTDSFHSLQDPPSPVTAISEDGLRRRRVKSRESTVEHGEPQS